MIGYHLILYAWYGSLYIYFALVLFVEILLSGHLDFSSNLENFQYLFLFYYSSYPLSSWYSGIVYWLLLVNPHVKEGLVNFSALFFPLSVVLRYGYFLFLCFLFNKSFLQYCLKFWYTFQFQASFLLPKVIFGSF